MVQERKYDSHWCRRVSLPERGQPHLQKDRFSHKPYPGDSSGSFQARFVLSNRADRFIIQVACDLLGARWVATLPTQQLGFPDGYVQSDSQSEPEELLALAAKVIELLPTLMRDIAY